MSGTVATLIALLGASGDVELPRGQPLYSARYTSTAAGVDNRLVRYLNQLSSPDKDIYQFGVFTGNGLHKIVTKVQQGHVWGFDSFQGIPPESGEEYENWKDGKGRLKRHFQAGGYSAANALGITSLEKVMQKVADRVGSKERVTLIAGFFNESLTDTLLAKHRLKPALHVDMDADIYLSAIQALDWMLAHRLIVPGTFIRYDDWPRFNSTFGTARGSNYFGQCRAHVELSAKYDLKWKLVARNALQVMSIGNDVCPESVCAKIPPLRTVLKDSAEQPLFPLWGVPLLREGLS